MHGTVAPLKKNGTIETLVLLEASLIRCLVNLQKKKVIQTGKVCKVAVYFHPISNQLLNSLLDSKSFFLHLVNFVIVQYKLIDNPLPT